MVQEGKLIRDGIRVGAFDRGAAEHDVDLVHQDIGPDAVPEQFDRLLVAVGLENAGATEFQEALARIGLDQLLDIELARCVEPAVLIGDFLTQQTVGADDFGFQPAKLVALQRRMIDHQHVITEGVVGIRIPAGRQGLRIGNGRHFLVEDLVAQPLRHLHFAEAAGEADLQRSDPAEALPETQHVQTGGFRLQPDGADLHRQTCRCDFLNEFPRRKHARPHHGCSAPISLFPKAASVSRLELCFTCGFDFAATVAARTL